MKGRFISILFVLLCLELSCKPENDRKTETKATGQNPSISQDALVLKDISGIHGGALVSCFLNDPKTFNPLMANDADSQTRNQLMNAGLVRLNRFTQQVEPALARNWGSSPDALTWTFHLRQGLNWSDGRPFTAADVIFTTLVANDSKVLSPAGDALSISGKQIEWKQIDRYTVMAKLPSPFAPFLRKLDSTVLPIIPRHKWESVYVSGKFGTAMSPAMNPKDFVSLGPFVLEKYQPHEKLVLTRNPHYWKIDRQSKQLPYLGKIAFLILSDLNHLQLKIENGEIQTFYSIRGEDVERLKKKAPSLGIKLHNLGPSYDYEGLFFNQNGDRNTETGKPFVDAVKRSWFSDQNFRKAVSYAIDRNSLIARALFGIGLPAYSMESPGNRLWYYDGIVKYPYDPAKAEDLLKSSGFSLKVNTANKKQLFDKRGNRVRFSLHTNSGNTTRNAACLQIASDLARIGIDIDYSALDFNALVAKITHSYDYDAILLGRTHDDPDPGSGMNVWMSRGSAHFWWPKQKIAQTEWERRVDELMNLQIATFYYQKRKEYYNEVQYIISDQLPMIFTATELVWVYAHKDLGNLKPNISRHRTLWNADELYWAK